MKKIILPEQTLIELKEQGLSYREIAKFFNDQGIKANYNTVTQRIKELYEKMGQDEPKSISRQFIKNHVFDEEIYKLRKEKLTYAQIYDILIGQGYNATKNTIRIRCKRIFAERGEEEPVIKAWERIPEKNEVSYEEVYKLRKKGMSYDAIAKYLQKHGKNIGMYGVRRKCKTMFEVKGEEEPNIVIKNKGRKKIDLPEEEIYNLKAQGLSYSKIADYYNSKGIKVCSGTIKNKYKAIVAKKEKTKRENMLAKKVMDKDCSKKQSIPSKKRNDHLRRLEEQLEKYLKEREEISKIRKKMGRIKEIKEDEEK